MGKKIFILLVARNYQKQEENVSRRVLMERKGGHKQG